MDFLVGLATGFIIGGVIAFIGLAFIMASGKLNKEHEAYREGYIAGVNSTKSKEVEN